jgi:hypothetical protein
MFNYLTYRVFRYFDNKEREKAVARTINFLVMLEGSLIVPIFMLLTQLEQKGGHLFSDDNKLKYIIGIPLFELIILIHSTIIKKKLQGKQLSLIKEKYHKEHYFLPVWGIFAVPFFFVFIFPIAFNGTMSFQYIEKILLGPLWV